MAKYIINTFSQDEYYFRMYHNAKKKTWQKIKQETGCYGLINTAYFNMKTYAVDSATMIAGKWLHSPKYHEYGLCVDKNGKLTLGTEKEAVYDYTVGLPPCWINGKQYNSDEHGRNGASFIGLSANGDVTCLIADKENGMTTAECRKLLVSKGCIHVFRFDGSWSSQGSLGTNLNLDPRQERKAAVYLLIYKKGGDTVNVELPVLRKGSKGAAVETLQQLLNAKGYECAADGSFGSNTLAALKKFQVAKKLVVDGSCGKNTWTALLTK